jgi:hypothetical protein
LNTASSGLIGLAAGGGESSAVDGSSATAIAADVAIQAKTPAWSSKRVINVAILS